MSVPDINCMGDCSFSPSGKEKLNEIIQKYNLIKLSRDGRSNYGMGDYSFLRDPEKLMKIIHKYSPRESSTELTNSNNEFENRWTSLKFSEGKIMNGSGNISNMNVTCSTPSDYEASTAGATAVDAVLDESTPSLRHEKELKCDTNGGEVIKSLASNTSRDLDVFDHRGKNVMLYSSINSYPLLHVYQTNSIGQDKIINKRDVFQCLGLSNSSTNVAKHIPRRDNFYLSPNNFPENLVCEKYTFASSKMRNSFLQCSAVKDRHCPETNIHSEINFKVANQFPRPSFWNKCVYQNHKLMPSIQFKLPLQSFSQTNSMAPEESAILKFGTITSSKNFNLKNNSQFSENTFEKSSLQSSSDINRCLLKCTESKQQIPADEPTLKNEESYDTCEDESDLDNYNWDKLSLSSSNGIFECSSPESLKINYSKNSERTISFEKSKKRKMISDTTNKIDLESNPVILEYLDYDTEKKGMIIIYSLKNLETIKSHHGTKLNKQKVAEELKKMSKTYDCKSIGVMLGVKKIFQKYKNCSSIKNKKVKLVKELDNTKNEIRPSEKRNVFDFQTKFQSKTDSFVKFVNTSTRNVWSDGAGDVPEKKISTIKNNFVTITTHQSVQILKSRQSHSFIKTDVPSKETSKGYVLKTTNRSNPPIRCNVEEIIASNFKIYFNYFAKLGQRLKSGTVITRLNSNIWLKKAGIIYDDESLKLINQRFTDFARKKLVLNIYDYIQFLLAISRGNRICLYDLVEQLKTVDISKTQL